jgi:hypothetical protein
LRAGLFAVVFRLRVRAAFFAAALRFAAFLLRVAAAFLAAARRFIAVLCIGDSPPARFFARAALRRFACAFIAALMRGFRVGRRRAAGFFIPVERRAAAARFRAARIAFARAADTNLPPN